MRSVTIAGCFFAADHLRNREQVSRNEFFVAPRLDVLQRYRNATDNFVF